jgi:hypothetical protein
MPTSLLSRFQQISVVRHLKDATLENNIFVTDVIDMEGQQFIIGKLKYASLFFCILPPE